MHLINQKETTLRRLSRDGSYLQAIKLRELLKELLESTEMEKELFINQFNLFSTGHCFKLLRSLGFSSNLSTTMFHNGATFNKEFEIASEFNNYFASVFNDKVISPLPHNTSSSNVRLNDLNLSFENITVLLKKCQDSSNTGAELVSPFVLFNCAEALSPVILDLFHWILNWKHWLEQWKYNLVTPLFKSGARNDMTNYRPINILPFLSLILEKILFDFIYPKLRQLIKREQHDFMKSRSTVSQMITYLDLVYSSCDNIIPALSTIFDFGKAFDSVPHHLLLSKLENFGLDLDFFHLFNSYLLNQYQNVRINKFVSFPPRVASGVPQGSVRRPLLFVLFINDIADEISNNHFYLFADDLKIFYLCR